MHTTTSFSTREKFHIRAGNQTQDLLIVDRDVTTDQVTGQKPLSINRKYESKVKSSSLAYNRCETQDKWSLDRDLDRSWCHHTSVKLSLLKSMAPRTSAAAWAATKKALHCVAVTPVPVQVPTQWLLVQSFTLVVG